MKLMLTSYIISYTWHIVLKSNGWIYKDEQFTCNIKDKVTDATIERNAYTSQ